MSTPVSAVGLAPGPETDRILAFLEGAGALAAGPPAGVPIGDDAAAVEPPPGERVVVSCDASVEGIHFRREWMTWETIGYRATAAALSDLAAMAAAPLGVLLSAALPPELGPDTAGALGRGLGEAVAASGTVLLGGDLTASPGPVMLDVVVLGHAPAPVTRIGARAGDEVWVTGRLGGAAAALQDLSRGFEPTPAARAAFERPRPRIREALWLRDRAVPRASIDLSDGLLRDARHVAHASGVRLEIEATAVPGWPELDAFRDSPAWGRLVLGGGEDYELLLIGAPGALGRLATAFEDEFDAALTRVGRVVRGSGLGVSGADGLETTDGFDHFRDG